MAALKGDFIGFQYGDYHSSNLEIMRVSDGSRYIEELTPVISDKIIEKSGNDGTYFFNSYYTQKPFDISFVYSPKERMAAHPPLPGLPRQEPSVWIVIFCIIEWYFIELSFAGGYPPAVRKIKSPGRKR